MISRTILQKFSLLRETCAIVHMEVVVIGDFIILVVAADLALLLFL